MSPDLRHTPLFAEHRSLGARFVSFAGWEMPIQYQGIMAEHRAVRTRAGLFDISHMGSLEARGHGALEGLDRLVTGDLAELEVGQALYTLACNPAGGIRDDLIVYRRATDVVFIVCNASNREKIVDHFADALAGLDFRDKSHERGLLALQGPGALDVLARARTSLDVKATIPSFHCAEATVAGVECMVARTGYTGEDGVELSCAREDGVRLWRALLEAGQPLGLVPVGLGARDTLRLEARLSLYGNEIDETTHPFEAGLGWVVKLDRGDFVGRDALLAIEKRPPERQLVALEVTDRNVARHGYPLLDEDGSPVGVCTSGAPSPTLGKNIGLGYLPVRLSAPSTEFWVDCRGKRARAVVVKAPFYRRPHAGTSHEEPIG